MSDNNDNEKNPWQKLNLKERQFILYFLGMQRAPDGYNCYSNKTRSYFYAYNYTPSDDPDSEHVPDIKKTVTEVNDEGNVEEWEEYTKEYKTAMGKANKVYEKDRIQEGLEFIRDEVKPHEELKKLAQQEKDMSIKLRANTKLLEMEGEVLSDPARNFADYVKGLAKAEDDQTEGDDD